MSTTKSRGIAEEFKWKKDGFIHVLHCQPGVKFYDVAKDPGNNPAKREKEIIIYPGQTLQMLSLNGHQIVWKVSPQ